MPIYHVILFLGRVICSSQKIFVILTKIRKSKKRKQKNHLSFTFNIKLKKKKNKTFFLSLFLSLRICFCFFIFLLPTKTNCLFCVVKKLLKCCLYTQMKKFLLPNVLVKRYMQKIRFNPPFNTYNHKYKHNTTDKYFSMGILLGQLGLVCMLYH